MISKELLSLVLNMNVDTIEHRVFFEGEYFESLTARDKPLDGYGSIKVYSGSKFIPIDTLGGLCKEWCVKNNYILKSFINTKQGFCIIETLKGKEEVIDLKIGDTEIKAIIKATEYVAKKKALKK